MRGRLYQILPKALEALLARSIASRNRLILALEALVALQFASYKNLIQALEAVASVLWPIQNMAMLKSIVIDRTPIRKHFASGVARNFARFAQLTRSYPSYPKHNSMLHPHLVYSANFRHTTYHLAVQCFHRLYQTL